MHFQHLLLSQKRLYSNFYNHLLQYNTLKLPRQGSVSFDRDDDHVQNEAGLLLGARSPDGPGHLIAMASISPR